MFCKHLIKMAGFINVLARVILFNNVGKILKRVSMPFSPLSAAK
jgi:hypothetical protein